MRVKVKICGIRTVDAAVAAVNAGADFLGFNFVPSSKRHVTKEQAKKIVNAVRGKITIVGVFQNQDIEKVNGIAKYVGLDFVQLHGKEDNVYIQKVKKPVIKSFTPIKSGLTLLDNPEILQVKYVILDRVVQGQGDMISLEKAALLARNFLLFLAGGLTPGNVSDIVKRVRPFAVDVASGIEINGEQDINKIRKFIERAKAL